MNHAQNYLAESSKIIIEDVVMNEVTSDLADAVTILKSALIKGKTKLDPAFYNDIAKAISLISDK